MTTDEDRRRLHHLIDAFVEEVRGWEQEESDENRSDREADLIGAWARITEHALRPILPRRLDGAFLANPSGGDGGSDTRFTAATSQDLHEPEVQCAIRRELARFLLDFSCLLPPERASQVAAALLDLNLGGDGQWLAKPNRRPGQTPVQGRRHWRNMAILCRIYYRAGYEDISLEQADALLGDTSGPRLKAVQDWRSKRSDQEHNIILKQCHWYRECGRRDRLMGDAYHPPIAADYDLAQLDAIIANL